MSAPHVEVKFNCQDDGTASVYITSHDGQYIALADDNGDGYYGGANGTAGGQLDSGPSEFQAGYSTGPGAFTETRTYHDIPQDAAFKVNGGEHGQPMEEAALFKGQTPSCEVQTTQASDIQAAPEPTETETDEEVTLVAEQEPLPETGAADVAPFALIAAMLVALGTSILRKGSTWG